MGSGATLTTSEDVEGCSRDSGSLISAYSWLSPISAEVVSFLSTSSNSTCVVITLHVCVQNVQSSTIIPNFFQKLLGDNVIDTRRLATCDVDVKGYPHPSPVTDVLNHSEVVFACMHTIPACKHINLITLIGV